jgi:PAS domain S-box-containing protein
MSPSILSQVPWIIGLLIVGVAAWTLVAYRRSRAGHAQETQARQAAETALVESEKNLDDIKYALDQSAIVATTNVKGDITYINDKFCEISKYNRDELMGQNHRILNSGTHSLEFFKEMYATIGRGHVWRGEIRNRAKDGSFYWVDTTIVPFLDDKGHPYQYIAIRYDITERKASEAALRDQQALAQLGKMAAVVAHEVRNPLAGMRGALQVIGKRLTDGSREQSIANEIIARIDTLNGIVQDLLQFARPRQPVFAATALGTVVSETLSLLRQDPALKDVEVHAAVDATVSADAEQVKLALLNLLMNSAQAMQGRGRIVVTSAVDGRWVELRIADHGPGIPPDVREHLFEPFYTTKHRGTGLGLATTRRIVEAHRGTIELQCPPDGGTTALIRLPVGG